ncbi:BMC_2a_G0024760.mRNA.1.CDS.1 [Saccharomyces cerevisiae]|nr:BMC_2a_G0024760.mRNA.1.CDS.1 [Saccharomyces cerevisiae]CAI7128361.1 BMC_2a_G0024760.mRNA.1.CDS.1 [Saccharomyces cerevisiae]
MHDLWVITTSPFCFEILYKYCKQKDRAQMTDLIVKIVRLIMHHNGMTILRNFYVSDAMIVFILQVKVFIS